jgi:hypothetical protein
MEPEELPIARQRLGKHVPAIRHTQATKEVSLETMFSTRSVQSDCKKNSLIVLCAAIPYGGGVEYLHRSPESRRRRRKEKPVPGGITGPPCSWGI